MSLNTEKMKAFDPRFLVQGGGVYFVNGTGYTIQVANSAFERNIATTGGALYAQDCDQAIYYNNVFMNNNASGSGGSIFLVSSCIVDASPHIWSF